MLFAVSGRAVNSSRTLLSHDDCLRVWLCADLVVVCWAQTPTHSSATVIADTMRSLADGTQRTWRMLVVVNERVELPTFDVRDALRQAVYERRSMFDAVALVVTGRSFALAAIRSALTAINVMVLAAPPVRVVSTVEEGIDWLFADDLRCRGARLEEVCALLRDR